MGGDTQQAKTKVLKVPASLRPTPEGPDSTDFENILGIPTTKGCRLTRK